MPFQSLSKAMVLSVWGLLIVLSLLGGVAFVEQVGLLVENSQQDEGALIELACAVKPANTEATLIDDTMAICHLTTLDNAAPDRGAATAPERAFCQRIVPAQNNLFILHSNYRI